MPEPAADIPVEFALKKINATSWAVGNTRFHLTRTRRPKNGSWCIDWISYHDVVGLAICRGWLARAGLDGEFRTRREAHRQLIACLLVDPPVPYDGPVAYDVERRGPGRYRCAENWEITRARPGDMWQLERLDDHLVSTQQFCTLRAAAENALLRDRGVVRGGMTPASPE